MANTHALYACPMPNPRNLLRRRPLLALLVLILLLIIGYTAHALHHKHNTQPPRAASVASAPAFADVRGTGRQPFPAAPSMTHDGGRFAANAAMPSCACGLAK